MYAIEGGGHTWPGVRPYLPRFLFGRTSHDLDVIDLMWRFFEQAGRPSRRGRPNGERQHAFATNAHRVAVRRFCPSDLK